VLLYGESEVERFMCYPVCTCSVAVATLHVEVKSEVLTDRSCLLHPHTAKPSYRRTVNDPHRQRFFTATILPVGSSLEKLIRHAWCHLESTRAAYHPFVLVPDDCEKPPRSRWIHTFGAFRPTVTCITPGPKPPPLGAIQHTHTAETAQTTKSYQLDGKYALIDHRALIYLPAPVHAEVC
jgi:hypothetical protein